MPPPQETDTTTPTVVSTTERTTRKERKRKYIMTEEQQELSKSQQKKLAKKAEKEAKKVAHKQAATAEEPKKKEDATDISVPAPVAADALPLKLVNASPESPDSIKVMWAATHFGVELEKGCAPLGVTIPKDTVALVQDGQHVVLGGNAIVQCLSYLSGSSGGNMSLMAENWCEIEQTQLAPSNNPKVVAAATKLVESALGATNGRHVVGQSLTVADICIVPTLAKASGSASPLVQTYVSAHGPSLESAKTAVQDLLTPKLDLSNPSLLRVVEACFAQGIKDAFDGMIMPPKMVSKCANAKHGDYQCSAAMPLFPKLKQAGGFKSPQAVAQTIIDAIGPNHPAMTDLKVNGPGFVLCKIRQGVLEHALTLYMSTSQLPLPLSLSSVAASSTACVVDFSSPNIAKEMHVGHLRSTIIGESVCRILEHVGYRPVHRVNHVGDWGTQFGMLIQYLKEEFPNFADNMPNITDLTAFYKAAKTKFDADEVFKKVSQLNVVKLQSGDEECMQIWNILCDVSRKEFDKVYKRLDISVKECGESFYNDRIPSVIEEFDKAGLIQIIEGGAKCVYVGDPYEIPLMLQKSDGGYGYDSTDMAALKYRLFDLRARRIIVITDFSQGDHFAMCNRAANMIGWVDKGEPQQLQHIGFGTVMGDDGKRFKTRSGDTVRLVDLLDEAVKRMSESLKLRMKEGKANIESDEELDVVAEAIGYSAVKYFDLRRNPTSNYKFSYDQMLDTKGNTAVYLLYTYARLESIMTKAKDEHGVDAAQLWKEATEPAALDHASERNLVFQLQQFPDIMELTLDDLYPYHICDYVYAVSVGAADFVTQCKVLGSPEMKSRLLLCKATTLAMRQCFELLGIRYVNRI